MPAMWAECEAMAPHDADTGVDEGETAHDGQARRDEVNRGMTSTDQRIKCPIRGQTVRERFVEVGTT